MLRALTIFAWVMVASLASAANYYVDPAGSNGGDGSMQNPWRTLLFVSLQTLQPGDTVYFKRDGVWNESLTPPTSGSAGSLIKFDAYGNGRAPRFTGALPVAAKWWTNVAGNVWKATLYSTNSQDANTVQCGVQGYICTTQPVAGLNFVQFGTVWGNAQSSQAALVNDRDWWYDATNYILYVYSASGNPAAHYGVVTPILHLLSVININGKQWIEVQHIQADWYDAYGVQVQGASDHIFLANLAMDSQVPNATVPIGFYIQPSGTPSDIHLYNTDAHRNYQGYRFEGTPVAVELKNCRAYANRTYGIFDNTGAVTYSYCHLYANNIATGLSTDVASPPASLATAINGGHNLVADTPPNVRGFLRYPARVTVTYDDPGLVDGSHQYIQALMPTFLAKGVPLSIATVTGYDLSNQLIPTFQSWINAGFDLNAHSVSHQYWNPPSTLACNDVTGPIACDAFKIQYIGTIATTVTMTVSHSGAGGTFEIDPSPFDTNAFHSWDLTPVAPGATAGANQINSLGSMIYTLQHAGCPNGPLGVAPCVFKVDTTAYSGTDGFGNVVAGAVGSIAKGAAHVIGLANVTTQDIKTAAYPVVMDESYLYKDEINWAKSWMNANLTGIGGAHTVTLSWTVASNVDGYNVYRGAASGGPYTKITPALIATDSYVDYKVNPQQVWYYVATSVKNGVESGYSNEVSATVPGIWVYVYPGSYEDSATEGMAATAGFAGSRGSGSMKPSGNAATVLGTGVNVQNVLSQGMAPYFQGLTDTQLANRVRALVFKSAVWGVPIGVFFHHDELVPNQVSVMLDALKASGATLMTNTQLVTYLLVAQGNAGTTFYADGATGVPDLRPTGGSPVVDQGAALSGEYKLDLMGVDQTLFGSGWEMGAVSYVPETVKVKQ